MIPYGYRRSILTALIAVAGLCATNPCQTIAAYVQGFDNVPALLNNSDPVQWAWLNQSESPTTTGGWWQASTNLSDRSFNAQNGPVNSYAWASFASSNGGAVISNWLISPTMTFVTGDTFSYWTRTVTGSSFPDRMQVRLSQSGTSIDTGSSATSVGSFTTLVEDINPTLAVGGYPEVWTKYTTTLSSSFTGRIGFRYFVTDLVNNGNYIGLDSFETTASVVPEPSTYALAGISLAVLASIRKSRRNSSH